MMTKLEAVKELQEMDHAFLTPEGVKNIGEPFGVYFTKKYQDQRLEFKGLYVPSVKEGDWVEGLDSAELAEAICDKEGVKYPSMFGRGSQLRACCNALIKHLTEKG